MNKLDFLIDYIEAIKNEDKYELTRRRRSTNPTKKDMIPFYSYQIGVFKDVIQALTILKEIINHLDVDVDYTDTDFNDIIHGYYFKLEFDNDDDKDFQIADELYEWYENETYNDEYWREEYERNER